jgi:tRNA G18 (ribose-2'-O)-methylase SpoU
VITVDDPDDPRVAEYIGLTDAELRKRWPELFVVEGVVAIRRLAESRFPVRSALVTPNRVKDLPALDAPVYVASQEVMNRVAGFDIHRGALAAAERLPPADVAALLDRARLVLVVEAVSDHENMGALFRNAAAFGVDAVLLTPDCCDPLYRRAVRVSVGHVLHVPFASVSDPVPVLRGHGISTWALTPDSAAEPIDAVTPGSRTALVVGAEGPGLRPETLAAADRRVRIPMAAGVDSLNVATAAAVALHRLAGRKEA